LLELTPQGEGRRWPLVAAENWIGRDPACAIALKDDILLNPRHARIHRDAKGRWLLENNKSHNGVWLRTEHVAIDGTCEFQLGEQRFVVRIL
jgi:pSer/pThr/pTyr-binding forkhead associated (FHA) protein